MKVILYRFSGFGVEDLPDPSPGSAERIGSPGRTGRRSRPPAVRHQRADRPRGSSRSQRVAPSGSFLTPSTSNRAPPTVYMSTSRGGTCRHGDPDQGASTGRGVSEATCRLVSKTTYRRAAAVPTFRLRPWRVGAHGSSAGEYPEEESHAGGVRYCRPGTAIVARAKAGQDRTVTGVGEGQDPDDPVLDPVTRPSSSHRLLAASNGKGLQER